MPDSTARGRPRSHPKLLARSATSAASPTWPAISSSSEMAANRSCASATALAWARRTAIAIDARSRASTPSSSSGTPPVRATT